MMDGTKHTEEFTEKMETAAQEYVGKLVQKCGKSKQKLKKMKVHKTL